MMSRQLHTIAIGLLLVACSSPGKTDRPGTANDPDQPDVSVVAAGEAVEDLGILNYSADGGNANADLSPVDTCGMVIRGGSLAILEFQTGIMETAIAELDCSGPYAESALKYRVRTLAVAAGPELPREFELIAVGHTIMVEKYEGDTVIAQVREANGEWFVGINLQVDLNADAIVTPERGRAIHLPHTFEELSEAAMRKAEDLPGECSERAQWAMTDAEWADYQLNPRTRGCRPVSGDTGTGDADCNRQDCDRQSE